MPNFHTGSQDIRDLARFRPAALQSFAQMFAVKDFGDF